ncbi:MAG TPA: phosphoribosylformylglycinamidine cyclo-ligase [candidate division WOR-3 bacterium]|uniref:Phosphoribosylformylglycinamidine cyclo-ligase n=1 Tax=candidate division WOR-3 bacterium TaxID=2052148 RepID=A0A7C5HMX1_UNCW3|nr:phosphoribosylformylglycinamidine cyclo-ligase [candidate division WOR-3 bacterium]
MLYKDSGVDTGKSNRAKNQIKNFAKKTFNKNVLSDVGLFAGAYKIPKEINNPILISSTDGIGTKVIVAHLMHRYKGLGADIVNHCVNDILSMGAYPIFFLDYFAANKINNKILIEFIEGVSEACIDNDCSLIGGETAEMPDVYPSGHFDIAGFIVGIVDKNAVITGEHIQPGDKVFGLYSSGLHTNGYSLARKIVFEKMGLEPNAYIPEVSSTIGETLLVPHTSYLKDVYPMLNHIKGIAHITGGGFKGNISRILPPNVNCIIDAKKWNVPPIFKLLQKWGDVPMEEMYKTFNMGIGMVLIGEKIKAGIEIGEIVSGSGEVILEGI